jgi:hypothetical protein
MARQQKQKDKEARRLEAKERKTGVGSMSSVKMGILPVYNLGRSLSQSSGIISEARINPCNEEAHPGLPRCDVGPEAP